MFSPVVFSPVVFSPVVFSSVVFGCFRYFVPSPCPVPAGPEQRHSCSGRLPPHLEFLRYYTCTLHSTNLVSLKLVGGSLSVRVEEIWLAMFETVWLGTPSTRRRGCASVPYGIRLNLNYHVAKASFLALPRCLPCYQNLRRQTSTWSLCCYCWEDMGSS